MSAREHRINNDDPPVTVAVTWRARAGLERDLDAAVAGIIDAAKGFPGHLGVDIYRLQDAAPPELRIVFRFDRRSNLRRWEHSQARADAYAQASYVADGPIAVQRLTGLEAWFDLPTGQKSGPPRWKMFLLTWAAAFPIAALIYLLLGTQLNKLPLPLRALCVTGLLVTTLTYAAMPLLTRLAQRWLTRPPPSPRDHQPFERKVTQR